MEQFRDAKIEVVVETNKRTIRQTFSLHEDETLSEMADRVRDFLVETEDQL